ncbi:hypothetical protein [Muricomes intestini]|jgi:hypothetical protein|uniref:hypothetical protein n=1 Tax=Muricomes intestini TaxID=1796634 RepID=UPI0026CB1045
MTIWMAALARQKDKNERRVVKGKLVGDICDNCFFLKPTESVLNGCMANCRTERKRSPDISQHGMSGNRHSLLIK